MPSRGRSPKTPLKGRLKTWVGAAEGLTPCEIVVRCSRRWWACRGLLAEAAQVASPAFLRLPDLAGVAAESVWADRSWSVQSKLNNPKYDL